MSTKFNVYYATTPNGPWTLANDTPIDRATSGLTQYTITGLNRNTLYYIAIIGGTMDGSDFVPLVSQPIGPKSSGAGDVSANRSIFFAKTFMPSINTEGTLSHQFEVT